METSATLPHFIEQTQRFELPVLFASWPRDYIILRPDRQTTRNAPYSNLKRHTASAMTATASGSPQQMSKMNAEATISTSTWTATVIKTAVKYLLNR